MDAATLDVIDQAMRLGQEAALARGTSSVVIFEDGLRLVAEVRRCKVEHAEHKMFVAKMREEFERIKGECADVSAEAKRLHRALTVIHERMGASPIGEIARLALGEPRGEHDG